MWNLMTVDLITMWDLLEHLADPRNALMKANRILAERGLLVLEIPDRDSHLHDLAKGFYDLLRRRVFQGLCLARKLRATSRLIISL